MGESRLESVIRLAGAILPRAIRTLPLGTVETKKYCFNR